MLSKAAAELEYILERADRLRQMHAKATVALLFGEDLEEMRVLAKQIDHEVTTFHRRR